MSAFIIISVGFTCFIVPSEVVAYTPHDPIVIIGNSDFHSQAAFEGWSGSGTLENPYIIKGYEITETDYFGIEIRNSTVNFVIQDVLINTERRSGILLFNVTNGLIEKCTIKENVFGIVSADTSKSTFNENKFSNNDVGIYLFNSTKNTIKNNNASFSTGEGILLANSYENLISDNTLLQNDYAIGFRDSDENTIIGNKAQNNNVGIQIVNSHSNNFTQNFIKYNDIGLNFVNNCTRNIVTKNIISSNDASGIILFSSNNNSFYQNNIFDNGNQLETSFSFNTWNNQKDQGNFWGDYVGSDENEDGVGDTFLPHQGVDNYPLMKPLDLDSDSNEKESQILDESWFIILMIAVVLIIVTYMGYKTGQRKKEAK